jgi:hypothetical protein
MHFKRSIDTSFKRPVDTAIATHYLNLTEYITENLSDILVYVIFTAWMTAMYYILMA